MQLLLPFSKKDRQIFLRNAVEIGFDQFVAHKFIYTILDSDLDVYQLMYDDRISLLIYGWEICEIYMQNARNTNALESYSPSDSLQGVIKWLSRYSLDLWLSKEWENCNLKMRMGLLLCMRRIQDVLPKIPEVALLNWNHMLTVWDLRPWQQRYVNRFLKSNKLLQHSTEQSIEEIEAPATKADIDYLREEDILIILLRLVKMLDSFFMEGAKQLSMRVIAAWNAVYERAKDVPNNENPQIPEEYKKCIISICHIYLLAVYEMDDNRGFVIDNMMNNIRFYHQSFLEKKFRKPLEAIAQLNFTPARFIALTCINLNITIGEFFEMFTCHSAAKNFCTLFGVISQSYISYILGNQLMEMNAANTDNFNANLKTYKRILNLYLEEREASEMFCRDQLHRQKLQRNSHTASRTMKNLTDFGSKFCKGNRPNNIGNCESTEEDQQEDQSLEAHTENAKKIDHVFQNIPNNEKILKHVYEMLANRTFDGWHFAKTILLLKIIGHEVNQIETWRYHPGLTIDFMLDLDVQLSKHYEDLALIFQEYYFIEQEFWLTAFYLNPIRKYYDAVMRCGGRFCRKQNQADEIIDPPKYERHDRGNEKHIINAKYGLLSSTIDVKEIVKITDHDKVNADYDAITKALDDLKLPESTIKDILTVTFLPRNRYFAWAVNWQELRKRCKQLLKCPEFKRSLVELNMAEANDRLKFLNVDYEKYKHRPQLDYGTIELGYESILNAADDSEDEDDDDDDEEIHDEENEEKKENADEDNDEVNKDFENSDSDAECTISNNRRGRKRKKPEGSTMNKKELEFIADIYSTGTRRTRARTAAALATARESEKIKENEKSKEKEVEKSNDDADADADKAPEINEIIPSEETKIEIVSEISPIKNEKWNLKELLQERPLYSNNTTGFQAFPDIWDFDSKFLQEMDTSCAVLPETEQLLQEFSSWRQFTDDGATGTEETTFKPLKQNDDSTGDDETEDISHEKEENILQEINETSAVQENTNIKIEKNIAETLTEESTQHADNNKSDGKEVEKDAIAVDLEEDKKNDEQIDSDVTNEKSVVQPMHHEAEKNISKYLDIEESFIVSDEPILLTTDETITIEEVIIEERETTPKPEDKYDEISRNSPAKNILDAGIKGSLLDSTTTYTDNEHSDEAQKEIQKKSDGPVMTEENSKIVVDKNHTENEVVEKAKVHIQNASNLKDDNELEDGDKLEDVDKLEDGDILKVNYQNKDVDEFGDDALTKVDDLLKNDDQLKEVSKLKDDQQSAELNEDEKLRNEDQLKDGDQHKDDSEIMHDREVEDGVQALVKNKFKDVINKDKPCKTKTEEISNEVNENFKSRQNETNDDQLKEKNDDINKNINLNKEQDPEETKGSNLKLNDVEKRDIENSAEKECNKIDKSKETHHDKVKVDTNEDNSNECEKLNVASIKNSETIETVLNLKDFNNGNSEKADEQSNSEKIANNLLTSLTKTDHDRAIGVDNSTDPVIENTLDKTLAISDCDDNSTNMSEGSLLGVKNLDTAIGSDKDDYEELCRKFELKDAIVRITRLTVNDLSQLRQPCVKLRRMDFETNIPLKRSLRKVEHKSYIGLDETSKSSNASSSSSTQNLKSYLRNQLKRKYTQSQTSFSSDDEEMLRPVKTARPQTARSRSHTARPQSARPQSARPQTARKRQHNVSAHQKKLIVTPRSASGLKMRISSAPSKKTQDNMELIQISSSSSSPKTIDLSDEEDEGLDPVNLVTTSLISESLINDDPLYEELILCD